MSDIFERQLRLKPSAMVTVAERRFDDAQALCGTGKNARANGAVYLAGFVIEILLKAQLVKKFNAVSRKPAHELRDLAEREVWSLIWRRHDLDGMLKHLTDLQAKLRNLGESDGYDYVGELKKCAQWSIQARYSPHMIQMAEAVEFLERVRRLKRVLQ
jgi:hypothetical protein